MSGNPVDLGDPATLPHDSLSDGVIVCAVLCFVIAAVFVALRFYTRTRILKVLAASDWFLLASLVGSGLQSAFFIDEAVHGLGDHTWNFDVQANFHDLQRSSWFAILWYNVTLLLIKVSFLLLYIRLFTYQRAEIFCKVILGIAVLAGVYSVVLSLTNCVPLQASWDLSITDAYCHSKDVWWSNTALHVVTDFLIWIVPIPQIWRIRIPKQQKITLLSLFSLGFLVAFISIIRIIYLDNMHKNADPDFAFIGAQFGFLSMIEVNAAIVVACLITLQPLLVRLFPRLFNSHGHEELPGNTPPTIGGSSQVARSAEQAYRGRGQGKPQMEEWEMGRTDVGVRTTAIV